MRNHVHAAIVGLGILASACGSVSNVPDTGSNTPDAAVIDAMPPTPDAMQAAARETREIVSGGGRTQGGGFTLEVQLGHGLSQGRATGGSFTVEGGASVKP